MARNFTMEKKSHQKIIALLKELDLSKSEITIYLLVLKLWSSSISQISHFLKLTRPSVYNSVSKLLEKWFLIKKNKVYIAISEQEIKNLIEKKKNDLDVIQLKLESMHSEFLELSSYNTLGTYIRHYEGTEWMITMLQEAADDKEEMYVISDNTKFTNIIDRKYYLASYRKRKKLWVKTHMLFTEGFLDVWKANRSSFLIELKTIPEEIIKDGWINIRWNKIAFHNYKDSFQSTVIIENKQIAHTMRLLFNLLWLRGKSYW